MKYKENIIWWIVGAVLVSIFLYAISNVLLPFIVAIIAAYFLNPAAIKLEKCGLSRTAATSIITCSFFILVIVVALLLAPILYNQLNSFLQSVPKYITYLNQEMLPIISGLITQIAPETMQGAKNSMGAVSGYALKFLAGLVANIWNSGIALLNLFSLLFVTPIVTFYVLKDWNLIVKQVDRLYPPKYLTTIKTQISAIDQTLAGYIRGQTNVCLILGVFYAVALSIIGLEFSLFIGLASGFLLFIPYVGALFGFVAGMLVAFFQFGDVIHIGIVAAIFLIGQTIESSFLTPNLVGNKVGLHPVWIMFGLLAGGAMFGFIGVLIAVPVTAVIGVLVRFFIGKYIESIKNSTIVDA